MARTRIAAVPAILAGLVIAAAGPVVSGCGSQAVPPGSSAAPTAPGSSAAPTTPSRPAAVIHLAAGFSPDQLRLKVGEQFLLIVSPHVRADSVPVTGGCRPGGSVFAGNGMLSVQCQAGGRYLYTARHAGSVTLITTVRPRCKPGTMCPLWLSHASLKLQIS